MNIILEIVAHFVQSFDIDTEYLVDTIAKNNIL